MGAEKRRAERLEGRFTVAVREKLATWVTRTEDVSSRGCRLEARRALTPGVLVELVFDMGAEIEPLVAHGQVAWARQSAPYRAGVAFLAAPRQASDRPGTPGANWIDRLLVARIRRIPPAEAQPSSDAGSARASRDFPSAATPSSAATAAAAIISPPPNR